MRAPLSAVALIALFHQAAAAPTTEPLLPEETDPVPVAPSGDASGTPATPRSKKKRGAGRKQSKKPNAATARGKTKKPAGAATKWGHPAEPTGPPPPSGTSPDIAKPATGPGAAKKVTVQSAQQAPPRINASELPAEEAQQLQLVPEDVGYGLRGGHTTLKYVRLDDKNPDRAFLAGYNGYTWVTEDGGATWTESTVLVEQRQLFQSPGQVLYAGHVRDPVMSSLQFSLGTYSVGPLNIPSPAPPQLPTGATSLSIMGTSTGNEGFSALGLGLSARAPRLSILISRRGRPIPSVNLKRLIVERGQRPSAFHSMTPHPIDPRIIYAGTTSGLYMSRDGGYRWVRIFLGTTPMDQAIEAIRFDPKDPKHMILGTRRGMYESHDGGDNFRKNTTFPGGWILSITISADGNYIYVPTKNALWRSPDGGRSWELPYFTTFPNAQVVYIAWEDPFDPNIGYIGTGDGIFKTTAMRTGGIKDWTRLGGLAFAQNQVLFLQTCNKHRGHLYALSYIDLPAQPGMAPTPNASAIMESWDGGANWKPIYTGRTYGRIEWFNMDPSNNDELWVVWTRSVERLRRGVPTKQVRIAEIDEQIHEILGTVATPGDICNAIFRRMELDPTRLAAIRSKARWSWLAPILTVSLQQNLAGYRGVLNDIQYISGPRFLSGIEGDRFNWAIFARWDLARVLFNIEQLPLSNLRIANLNTLVRGITYDTMTRSYSEMLRLQLRDAVVPPKTLKAKVFSALRLEELQSILDFYAGNRLNLVPPKPPKGVLQ